jgi:hypothetical protein
MFISFHILRRLVVLGFCLTYSHPYDRAGSLNNREEVKDLGKLKGEFIKKILQNRNASIGKLKYIPNLTENAKHVHDGETQRNMAVMNLTLGRKGIKFRNTYLLWIHYKLGL